MPLRASPFSFCSRALRHAFRRDVSHETSWLETRQHTNTKQEVRNNAFSILSIFLPGRFEMYCCVGSRYCEVNSRSHHMSQAKDDNVSFECRGKAPRARPSRPSEVRVHLGRARYESISSSTTDRGTSSSRPRHPCPCPSRASEAPVHLVLEHQMSTTGQVRIQVHLVLDC
jgi:hypothetical protein